MRSLITLFIVLSCGAAAMVISSRASKAVDAKTGAAQASLASLAVESFTLDLVVSGGDAHWVKLSKSGLLQFSGLDSSIKITDADRAEIQAAFGRVPERLWRESAANAEDPYKKSKAAGGDFYYVSLAGNRTVHARADGWRASGLDGIKTAVWQVIRRRAQPAVETDPKKKTKKGVEFVAPFEAIRNALRIKF